MFKLKHELFLKFRFNDNLFGLVLVLLHWDISKFYCALLKGHFTSGKMNVYLKWVIYVEEM